MRVILTIGLLGLRRIFRDRITVFFVVLFPMMIIGVIGFAVFGSSGVAGGIPLGVVSSGGVLADDLIDRLSDTDNLTIRRYSDETALRKAVRRESVGAGVLIGPGYDESLRSGLPTEVEFVTNPTSTPAFLRSSMSAAIAEQGGLVKAAAFATSSAGGKFDERLKIARQLAGSSELVDVEIERAGGGGNKVFTGFNYPAASNLVLFIFITSLAGAASIIMNRQLGVTRRTLAGPVTPRRILLGEGLGRFVVALFQALLIVTAGLLIFNVDWGDPVAAIAITVLFALVGTSVSLLLASILRNPNQAGAVGPPIGIGLGMLGGCMWPLEIVPAGMRAAGHITPHAWAMDAFIKTIGRGAKLADITTELGALALFVIILLPLAAWRLRKTLTT